MKIKLSELRKLIREAVLSEEAIEVYNNDTGELIDTLTRADADKYTALRGKAILGGEIFLDDDEYENLMDELERERLVKKNANKPKIDDVLNKLEQWAQNARKDFLADNPSIDMQDVARDLAWSAEDSFSTDEWYELMSEFEFDEDALMTAIADMVAG